MTSHGPPRAFICAIDLIVFSHLRWDFVYQRPQHLVSRFSRAGRVLFVEEPIFEERTWVEREVRDGVEIVRPHLDAAIPHALREGTTRRLLRRSLAADAPAHPVVWFYTPMMLPFLDGLAPAAVVYDCMDQLSAFAGAPEGLVEREEQLLRLADVVFTGGRSLYEAKRHAHANVHCFPSSVEVEHFARARGPLADPEDQRDLTRPRLGFFGVIDERMDLALVDALAEIRPQWSLVMVGPTAKIPRSALPVRPNIHYLGKREYRDLPAFLANWDVAIMPFARNQATRYISPTKVLEYLAAGVPVVSTSIHDVVTPYGERQLVRIADSPTLFALAVENALREDPVAHRRAVDQHLAGVSWDATYRSMRALVADAVREHGRDLIGESAA